MVFHQPGKPWDGVLMFKALVIVSLYNLSDEQLEFQIEDRRSFQRFIGLSDAKHAPDRNGFWQFRESLKELKLTEALFNEFNRQMDRDGMIARKGQLIVGSFVTAPAPKPVAGSNTRLPGGCNGAESQSVASAWLAPKGVSVS
jgi:IS5 family transposase